MIMKNKKEKTNSKLTISEKAIREKGRKFLEKLEKKGPSYDKLGQTFIINKSK